jgi:diacylglycerol kinase (ATP)
MARSTASPPVVIWANGAAGRGRATELASRAAALLSGRGAAPTIIDAPDAATATAAAEAALGPDGLLVAVGGDGTVHHALQLIAGSGRRLAVLPCGSGDDVARLLGLSAARPDQAFAALTNGATRRIDVGSITTADGVTRRYAAAAYAGFDAQVNARANRLRIGGRRTRYPLAVVGELAALRAVPMVVDIAGSIVRRPLLAVVVGNGPTYGGGMRICPTADPHDGLLDLTLVEAVPRRTLVRVLPTVYRGDHVRHPAVTTARSRTVTLAAPGARLWADGEPVGDLPAVISVEPSALEVVVA